MLCVANGQSPANYPIAARCVFITVAVLRERESVTDKRCPAEYRDSPNACLSYVSVVDACHVRDEARRARIVVHSRLWARRPLPAAPRRGIFVADSEIGREDVMVGLCGVLQG